MELNPFIHRFENLIKREELETRFEFYLFGSFLKSQYYIDIDVLVIYTDCEYLNKLKKIINDEFFDCLIHLTCLTKKEEIEFDFINMTNAKRLLMTSGVI